jgi:hypothetical protein
MCFKMFDPKKQIWDADTMKKYIQRKMKGPAVDQPRKAIQRIKAVIGVFIYMQETRVNAIFKAEKVRIGSVLDGIDKNLPKTPRIEGNKQFTPWKTLGLGAKWDKYMDDVFKTAKNKGTKFVEDNIKLLKEEYTSKEAKDKAKDDKKKTKKERDEIKEWAVLCENIEKMIIKLEETWKKTKDWKKPW